MESVKGKNILITGATGGIGSATSKTKAEEQLKTMMNYKLTHSIFII